MKRIGVIGLGGMGKALVEHLLAEDYTVTCFDTRTEALAATAMHGASTAVSPRQVAQESDVVITFLPGPDEVLDVALHPETGVLGGLAEGAILLDMSTCGPDVAVRIAEAFTRGNRLYLDCPVSGRIPTMTVLVGGEQGVLGANEEFLKDVSGSVIYCGRIGAGYAVKLLNQHVKYAWYLASAEALLIARSYGLDPAFVAKAIEEGSGGKSGLAAAAEYFSGDTSAIRRHGPTRTIDKDMRLAEELADSCGISSPTLQVVADFFREAGRSAFAQKPFPESNALLAELRSNSAAVSNA